MKNRKSNRLTDQEFKEVFDTSFVHLLSNLIMFGAAVVAFVELNVDQNLAMGFLMGWLILYNALLIKNAIKNPKYLTGTKIYRLILTNSVYLISLAKILFG